MFERSSRRDLDGIQGFLAADLSFENPVTGRTDLDGMRNFHTSFFEALPDPTYHVDWIVSHGETAPAQCTITGTHKKDLMGIPPADKKIELPVAFVVDFEKGKVRNWASYFDTARMMRQLGVMP